MGEVISQTREAYDRGMERNLLLYNQETKSVISNRQFRSSDQYQAMKTGMMIEACAGLLIRDNAKIAFEGENRGRNWLSDQRCKKSLGSLYVPGSVTEILYLFVAAYSKDMKVGEGGGRSLRRKNIEVLEMPFDKALEMD